MTTENVAVTKEFLQKVVGFAEASNAMMKQAEESRASIRTAAEGAVDVLEKAGMLGGHDKQKLIDGIVNKPEMAVKLAAAIATEYEKKAKAAPAAPAQDKAEADVKAASIGAPAEPEKGAKPAQTGKTTRESDEVWNRGFNF